VLSVETRREGGRARVATGVDSSAAGIVFERGKGKPVEALFLVFDSLADLSKALAVLVTPSLEFGLWDGGDSWTNLEKGNSTLLTGDDCASTSSLRGEDEGWISTER
jgi:hypothetical protein